MHWLARHLAPLQFWLLLLSGDTVLCCFFAYSTQRCWCSCYVLLYAVWSGNRNIVSTVNLDCKLDLKAIALQARNAEYNPKVGLLFQCIFVFIFILHVVLSILPRFCLYVATTAGATSPELFCTCLLVCIKVFDKWMDHSAVFPVWSD